MESLLNNQQQNQLLEMDEEADQEEEDIDLAVKAMSNRNDPNALTPQIYVVPYRAPELVLGERQYRHATEREHYVHFHHRLRNRALGRETILECTSAHDSKGRTTRPLPSAHCIRSS